MVAPETLKMPSSDNAPLTPPIEVTPAAPTALHDDNVHLRILPSV
jgi:hypothetical protein